MCISSEKNMVELPKELQIKITCSSSKDLNRRFMIITEARRNCEFPVTTVGSLPRRRYFLNFEFFLTSFRNILQDKYFLPQGIFTVINKLGSVDKEKERLSRATPVSIEGFNSLLTIRTSKITGKLDFPISFISGDVYK